MIARCRAKCWIIQLKEDNQDRALPSAQRGMHGHIIIYPQRPQAIASILPPPMQDIITPICVIFVGSSPPTQQWLQEKAKPLGVRREKVRAALEWLKAHNRFYKDIIVNHDLLNTLPERHILPVHIEHILPDLAGDTLTSRYDATQKLDDDAAIAARARAEAFQSVVITDVDGHAPMNELRAGAVRHVKQKGGAYVQVPHAPDPANEFFNPDLFPMIYPTLFPYGIGGFEDRNRRTALSMKKQVQH
ncbi:hypothetical protein BV25DRAFT_1809591, partial [Artomyces pyxidatus]